jgi:hypothetical protein
MAIIVQEHQRIGKTNKKLLLWLMSLLGGEKVGAVTTAVHIILDDVSVPSAMLCCCLMG